MLILAAITLGAGMIRVPKLGERPMHCDEAVHAYKFGDLLEQGKYVYDPNEYHGPTLNYLTLIPAGILGHTTYIDIDEFTVRIVPVFFGLLLVGLVFLLADGLGAKAVVSTAILTAFSPVLVFYSRYYIQETLLVCFTFGAIICGYRFAQRPRVSWAIGIGAFLGLMHATKETCIIAYGAMFGALVLWLWWRWREGIRPGALLGRLKPHHVIAVIVTGGIFAEGFFSSFLINLKGIPDSFITFWSYFFRAGETSIHIHPWYYYLKMLMWSQYGDGPVWTEGLIVVLAVVGGVAVVRKKGAGIGDNGLWRYVVLYTLLMTVGYSIIPYKTPWCLMGFFHGMILLAGVGAVWLIGHGPNRTMRALIGLVLAGGVVHLGWQAYQASYRYSSDPRNPYVYAHTSRDIFQIEKQVREVMALYPAAYPETYPKEPAVMQVFFLKNYWPLPWYLRDLNVEYYATIPEGILPAPLVLADPDMEPQLMDVFYENPEVGQRPIYVPLFIDTTHQYLQPMYLRPQVEIRGYLRKRLWSYLP